jgi:pimeloyl-ACP methyl ester carboxylesterase
MPITYYTSSTTSKLLDVNGGTVAYQVNGTGPAVVLTHGTPSWSFLWRRIVPVLAEHCTVYTWDLLGYGFSQTNSDTLPSIALHARTLAELVKLWGLSNPFLVGHDIGGASTLRAHLLEAAPARGLALIDAVAFTPWIGPDTRHMQRNLPAYRTMPNSLFQAIVSAHFDGVTDTPIDRRTRGRYLDFYTTDAGQQRWLNRTEGYDENDTHEFIPRLGTIDIPTTVIWGEDDGFPWTWETDSRKPFPPLAKLSIPPQGTSRWKINRKQSPTPSSQLSLALQTPKPQARIREPNHAETERLSKAPDETTLFRQIQ